MWYVRKQGVYYKRRMDGTPIFVKPSYLANGHTEWNAKFAKAVTVVLDERGHLFNDVTYAFSEVQPDLLNLMDKSLWIQPKAGEYHPVFDWITHSAGGGKPEAVDHIRHCIVHKYPASRRLHPASDGDLRRRRRGQERADQQGLQAAIRWQNHVVRGNTRDRAVQCSDRWHGDRDD